MRLTAALVGVSSVWSAPGWLTAPRLAELRRVAAPSQAGATNTEDVEFGVRVALRILPMLASVPGDRWKNTCLYQSVAECLVLRHYGVPATVSIGVRNAAPPDGPILAHAWVDRADGKPAPEGFQELENAPLVALMK